MTIHKLLTEREPGTSPTAAIGISLEQSMYWLGDSIVRVAIMPGMAHAKELSMGIKLFPCNPTLLIRRSIRKAARAM